MISKSIFFQSPPLPFTQTQQFHFRRRRRLKLRSRTTSISSQSEPPNTFHTLISPNSLQVIAPALAFAAGAALYLSRLKTPDRTPQDQEIGPGECTLLAAPSPFNQFVFQRCASIMIEGELEEKLVKEDGHAVKVRVKELEVSGGAVEEGFDYQRVCVATDDGGVVSLDWPEKLDLGGEHGRDTAVVIVPGTPEGSMEKNVRLFVSELLRCGCFPIVMNPRGCAGSPLTTARLFTAADSDDICTAIQFVNKARPCNTLMAVGWGNGANMLTKYLAEFAERTPLKAAACIDNPFDLEEATKSFPYHVAVDQKLLTGLIDILRSNKELFLGRENGFNVQEALSAMSLRDFDREISMISYGFESIEEFYSKSSTRELVRHVKTPLLFIQSDDGTVPPFSIPRSSVAENPFTSMFLCSRIPPITLTSEKSVLPWCEHFVIEWLTSVELGLLKGRHPLLKYVDVTINPLEGSALVDSSASYKNSGVKNFLSITEMDASNRYTSNGYPVSSTIDATTDNLHLESQRKIAEGAESQGETGEMLEQSGSGDTALMNDTGDSLAANERSQAENGEKLDQSGSNDNASESNTVKSSEDNARSQVRQSAEVVMNMLDVSMPGTLQEEQKKKVLASIEQGETLVKALEGALPEDVRGKIDNSIAQIRTKAADGNQMNNEMNLDVLNDKNKSSSVSEVEDSHVSSSIEPPPVQVESNPVKKDEAKNVQPIEDQNNQDPSTSVEPAPSGMEASDPPSPNVPPDIDALTEVDDSTQVAVNSVIGVVENMIDKSENDNDQEKDGKQGKSEDRESSSAKESVSDPEDMPGITETENGPSLESDQRQCKDSVCNHQDNSTDLDQNVHTDMDEKQLDHSHSTSLKKNHSTSNPVATKNDERKKDVTDFTLSAKTSDEVGHLRKFPLYVTINPYRDFVYDEHLHPYLLSSTTKLDLNSTADLLLDYLPKEGQWKFLDQTENNRDPDSCHGTQPNNGRGQVIHSTPHANDTNKINETSYIIADTGKKQPPIEKHRIEGGLSKQPEEKQPTPELVSRKQQYFDSDSSTKATVKHEEANSDTVIAGAVTALGASTLLGHEQSEGPNNCDESVDILSGDHSKSGNNPKELDAADKKGRKHIVSNLAEKAMKVAGPVVPTKSDGGLDQERLVTMFSDLGQKGGILKMFGKIALLWGGARGAVRLTDRLIAFLHIADRPLYQRLLGFACMVLVLWSPVVIPLFPTMVRAWATHNSTGITEYVCVIGLYTAVAVLVLLWGKRIRGYKDPLEQYGLDLTSKVKLFAFSKGLMGGIMLVLSIHAINALLGYAHLSWASLPSSSVDAIKACGGLLVLIGQGIMTAAVVVTVEEMLFRSWLPEEISVDFGYNHAVIISGFAFSVLQRSLHSIPGLWLLSIALFGLRQRSKGSLSMPIGMRAGILSSSFILQTGRFLIYHSNYPLWLVGTDPLQPFGGAVGLTFCIMLAILFYPKQPQGTKKSQRAIHE